MPVDTPQISEERQRFLTRRISSDARQLRTIGTGLVYGGLAAIAMSIFVMLMLLLDVDETESGVGGAIVISLVPNLAGLLVLAVGQVVRIHADHTQLAIADSIHLENSPADRLG